MHSDLCFSITLVYFKMFFDCYTCILNKIMIIIWNSNLSVKYLFTKQRAKEAREMRRNYLTPAHKYIMGLVANQLNIDIGTVEEFVVDSERVCYIYFIIFQIIKKKILICNEQLSTLFIRLYYNYCYYHYYWVFFHIIIFYKFRSFKSPSRPF